MSVPKGRLDIFANIRGWAPSDLLAFLDQILLLLPEGFKYRLARVLESLPAEGDNLHRVLEVVRGQWRDLQSDFWVQIAVVGPSGTGKASLLQAIAGRQAPDAPPIFSIVDLQGLDEFLGYRTDRTQPEGLERSDLILLVLDARFEITGATLQMLDWLRVLDKPVLVLLNKIDQVTHPWKTIRIAKRQLRSEVFGVSVHQPDSINRLLKAVVAAQPKTLYPLARTLPDFRRGICHGIATQAALAAGLVGAIPIPVSDLLPLTAIQTGMLLKIARAFGYRLNRDRARELLPMLAAGILVREGSHRLRQRFPEQDALIAVSVAGLWTFLLGMAAAQYFQSLAEFMEGRSSEFPLRSTLGQERA